MKNIPYQEAIGSLMYAAMGTRPDIAFTTSTVAQFSENPGWVHWEAIKRIYKYLLGMKKLELTYGGDKRGLVGYVDADVVFPGPVTVRSFTFFGQDRDRTRRPDTPKWQDQDR